MATRKVELCLAYEWVCGSCGRNNFASAVACELTPEDIEEMREEHGGGPEGYRPGQWVSRPDEVTCGHCGERFETESRWGGAANQHAQPK